MLASLGGGMSVDDAASRTAPATLDPATLDVTAILRHVVDVETSLPPPRGQCHPSNNTNVNAHPGGPTAAPWIDRVAHGNGGMEAAQDSECLS